MATGLSVMRDVNLRTQLVSVCVLLLGPLGGCASPAREGVVDADVAVRCVGSCETMDWPRVILAVSGGGASEAGITAHKPDGGELELYARGCPELPGTLICSYSIVSSDVRTVEVTVTLTDGTKERTRIELMAYNSCGRDIAYQEIAIKSDAVAFYDTRYVSPCSQMGLPP